MQTSALAHSPTDEQLSQPRDLTIETTVDRAILIHVFGAAISAAIAYVAAVMTTTVEPAGFWRSLWLGICIATFIYSFFSVILVVRQFNMR
ncbi:MAG TPA: hypothetical protein VE860_17135 [Chthoniobacterales bacterium]|jgi:ABC-type multidrug transport system permease subunit|nr:hypothetical protein [Chthoniobacterales bacterium]